MQLLYVIGTGVLAAFCVLLAVRICYQRRYIRTSDRINDCIFRNVAAYLLLIDPDFNVLQTNYRSATGTAPQAVPPKVGNLLRCRNGEDAGVCGTHELCADCPVRAAMEAVGVKNIRTKSYGTSNPINCVKAAIEGLKELRTVEEIAALRGKTVEEIKG